MIRKLIYFGYYLKSTDKTRLNYFLDYVVKTTGKSKFVLLKDMFVSSFRYNISLLDYFFFRFYEKDHELRSKYAGTGYMYEVHRIFNPVKSRNNIHKKDIFLKNYRQFIKHDFATLDDLEANPKLAKRLLSNPSGRIVTKNSDGECGNGVMVLNSAEFDSSNLLESLKKHRNNLVEEFVVQHPKLMKLSPSGLNTIRLQTQLDFKDQVSIIGATLRITVNSTIDNLAAGNLAAPLDAKTGIVTGPAIYSDITKEDKVYHPITGQKIEGFEVPFWNETLELIKKAAIFKTDNRSIGWDIAITKDGPDIIEANHAWCKLVWQLPGKVGLKPILDSYLREIKLTSKG